MAVCLRACVCVRGFRCARTHARARAHTHTRAFTCIQDICANVCTSLCGCGVMSGCTRTTERARLQSKQGTASPSQCLPRSRSRAHGASASCVSKAGRRLERRSPRSMRRPSLRPMCRLQISLRHYLGRSLVSNLRGLQTLLHLQHGPRRHT